MVRRWCVAAGVGVVLVAPAPSAVAGGSAGVAALQVGLRARGAYDGSVDGLAGPRTRAGVVALQRRRGLAADGVAGPRTRRALGRLGRPAIGVRVLRAGMVGWDVAALQFRLETHGFPLGSVDGGLGARTTAAVVRLQRWAGLVPDGVAGPAVTAVLRRPAPRAGVVLARPVPGPVGDRYGPRGTGMHAGLDFPAPSGTAVRAASSGRVVEAGWEDGFGRTVVLDHGGGLRTRYAHLSAIAHGVGADVVAGALVGRVGATGRASGPHLHFEVTRGGANVDPAPPLGLG